MQNEVDDSGWKQHSTTIPFRAKKVLSNIYALDAHAPVSGSVEKITKVEIIFKILMLAPKSITEVFLTSTTFPDP